MGNVSRALLASLAVLLLIIIAVAWGIWMGLSKKEANGAWGRDYFGNIQLVDQDGRKLRLFDDLIEGKVVLVNFIFTSCGDSCPLETARLRQVQKLLGERVGKDVHFYSISIDPIHDTPEVLNRYAKKFDVGPGWKFLSGDVDEVNQLRRKLGLLMSAEDASKLSQHSLSVIIGNQSTGQWMKVSPFENPYVLADKLGNTLHNWKDSSKSLPSYADAPAIRPPSTGEQLYRTRCSSCHTLGPQEGSLAGMPGLGPDLLGVTRLRERAWLMRWLREPDRMLAEKDPLAVQLFEKYGQVPMPNLRLSDGDIEALLKYMDEETVRLQARTANGQKAMEIGEAN